MSHEKPSTKRGEVTTRTCGAASRPSQSVLAAAQAAATLPAQAMMAGAKGSLGAPTHRGRGAYVGARGQQRKAAGQDGLRTHARIHINRRPAGCAGALMGARLRQRAALAGPVPGPPMHRLLAHPSPLWFTCEKSRQQVHLPYAPSLFTARGLDGSGLGHTDVTLHSSRDPLMKKEVTAYCGGA